MKTEASTAVPDKVTHGDIPGGGQYVWAAVIPIVGVILAILAWARGHVGPGLALMATSWTSAFLFWLPLVVAGQF